MDSTTLLANQMRLIQNRIAGLATLTRAEWLARLAPGDNRVGFLVWHMVATRDWTVRPILSAARPVGWDAPFAGTGVGLCHIPFGMSLEEADAVAEATSPAQVVEYSAAVTDALVDWLQNSPAAALDAAPSRGRDHLSLSSRYDDPAYRHELFDDPDDMTAWPVWMLLTRPCFAHCMTHLTEIESVRKELARG